MRLVLPAIYRNILDGCLLMTGWTLLSSVVVLMCMVATGAKADNRQRLMAAFDVIIVRQLEERREFKRCEGSSRVADKEQDELADAAWTPARDMLLAFLKNNAFPDDYITAIARRTDPAVLDSRKECEPDDGLVYNSDPEYWTKQWKPVFEFLSSTSLLRDVGPEERKALVKKAFDDEGVFQAEVFRCYSVSKPQLLPLLMMGWQSQIGVASKLLERAGFSRQEITEMSEPVLPEHLLRPVREREKTMRECFSVDHVARLKHLVSAEFIVGLNLLLPSD